jgi:hypothetical protein
VQTAEAGKWRTSTSTMFPLCAVAASAATRPGSTEESAGVLAGAEGTGCATGTAAGAPDEGVTEEAEKEACAARGAELPFSRFFGGRNGVACGYLGPDLGHVRIKCLEDTRTFCRKSSRDSRAEICRDGSGSICVVMRPARSVLICRIHGPAASPSPLNLFLR